jgi:uncharacterized protein YjbI with pentapeptide repeats
MGNSTRFDKGNQKMLKLSQDELNDLLNNPGPLDLSNKDLSGAILSNADLKDAKLEGGSDKSKLDMRRVDRREPQKCEPGGNSPAGRTTTECNFSKGKSNRRTFGRRGFFKR